MNVLVVSENKGTGIAVFCKLNAITGIGCFIVAQPNNLTFCKMYPIDLLVWEGDYSNGMLTELREYFPQSNIVTIDEPANVEDFPFEDILRLMRPVKRPSGAMFTKN